MNDPVLSGKAPARPRSPRGWDRATRSVLNLIIRRRFGTTEDERALKLIEETEWYRDDLAGPDPTPLELALCEQSAVAWLDLRCAEAIYLRSTQSAAVVKFLDQQVTRSHQRLLRTLRSLAAVRRVPDLRAVQINIAPPDLRSIADRFRSPSPASLESAPC